MRPSASAWRNSRRYAIDYKIRRGLYSPHSSISFNIGDFSRKRLIGQRFRGLYRKLACILHSVPQRGRGSSPHSTVKAKPERRIRRMEKPDFDVVILGAGPVGSALALALARKAIDPSRIALLGSSVPQATPAGGGLSATAGVDPRCLALNHGSRIFLETLQAWPEDCAVIRHVHVSQRQRLGRVVIDSDDLNVPRLGDVVRYDDLLASLQTALAASGVTCIAGRALPRMVGDVVECRYDAGRLTAALAVQSDGARPQGLERNYGQHALLATVRVSRPMAGWAYERFTRDGPLAALPHPQGHDLYSIVWCCAPQKAEMLRGVPQCEW